MDVAHVALLANLPITPQEEEKFDRQFTDTLKTVDLINELDTTNTPPTYQVTGLVNVFREDVIDTGRMLSQDQALSNAPKTYNGYFQVPSVFHEQ